MKWHTYKSIHNNATIKYALSEEHGMVLKVYKQPINGWTWYIEHLIVTKRHKSSRRYYRTAHGAAIGCARALKRMVEDDS